MPMLLQFALYLLLNLTTSSAMLGAILKPGVFKHINCRNNIYPRSNIQRFPVPDDLVYWSETYNEYAPPDYTAPHINGQIWADPKLPSKNFQPLWNQNNGQINRVSLHGTYIINDGRPVNPIGRTGLVGRGLLGRWGPNHAADPVVTRWKRGTNDCVLTNVTSGKGILQMVVIQRHDNKMWAIPGGMVDPGEKVSATLRREFTEEALNFTDKANMVEEFFAHGNEVYSGYIDDFRNTDNAWIETVAYNFHDETGTKVGKLQLEAGDDATNVHWVDIDRNLKLHANHADIVAEVIKKLDAHW